MAILSSLICLFGVSFLGVLGEANAQSMTIGPIAGVVTDDSMALRPGLRIGFEPNPNAALEIVADGNAEGAWDGGLSLSGRWYMSAEQQAGSGLFLLGRFTAGVSGNEAGLAGPWTGLAGGFGARPIPFLDLSVSSGPEWVPSAHARWRTELGVSVVISGDTFGGSPGSGSIWHRPRPIPGR